MALKAQRLVRKFNYNGTIIPDPNPNMTAEAVVRSLSSQYPELANAKVEEGAVGSENGSTVQTFNISTSVGKKG